MDLDLAIGFAAAFFVFAASPGPDNMTIVARTVSHGPLSGLAYGLGTVAGILVYLSLAAFGLSLLAGEFGPVLVVMRYLGGLYLIWLAIGLWRAPATPPAAQPRARGKDFFRLLLTGLALNLGNPKMPLFYVALLPNFVGTDFTAARLCELAAIIVAVEIVVIGGHIALAIRAKGLIGRPSLTRRVNRTVAALFFGAGIAALSAQGSR